MEIMEYLRLRRRRLWVVAAIPIASGAAVGAYVLYDQPVKYAASAVVAAPALVGGTNQYSGAQATTQYVASFEAAATSNVVARQVAATTHILPRNVLGGTTVAQVGTSPIMRVTFESANRKIVGKIAGSVATQTLRYLFDSQVTLAQDSFARAQQAVDALAAQMAAVGKTVNAVNPDQLYQALQQQVLNLQQQMVQQRASGNVTGGAAIASQIASAQAQLAGLAPTVQKYDTLVQRHEDARAVLTSASQALAQARTQQAAADPARVVTVSATKKASRLPLITQKVAPAVGAGLFLAVMLLATWELLSRREPDALPDAVPAPRYPDSAGEANGMGDRISGLAVGTPINS